jgi:D-lactate dehydrogenase
VIISTLRLDKLHLLDKGEQVLAFPAPPSIRWKKR